MAFWYTSVDRRPSFVFRTVVSRKFTAFFEYWAVNLMVGWTLFRYFIKSFSDCKVPVHIKKYIVNVSAPIYNIYTW